MFSRIRKRMGTSGMILGIIALIIALGGTAIAALPGLNSRQKKEVKKIAKKYAGIPGSTGPQGPVGASGSQGSKGDTGPKGDRGENGERGEPGPTETKLLPGQTETGAWSFAVPPDPDRSSAGTFVTYSFPLRVEPAPHFDPNTNWNPKGAGETTPCPGTAKEPEAAPGEFCVYASELSNAGAPIYYNTGAPEFNPDRTSGIVLEFVLASGAGEAYGTGTWAVTAACPEEAPEC